MIHGETVFENEQFFQKLKVDIFVNNYSQITIELRHEISNNMVCGTRKVSHQAAHTHSLIRAFASHLNIP